MFPPTISGDTNGIANGHSYRFRRINFTDIFQQTADAPRIRFQGDGYNRKLAFLGQLDAQGVKGCRIELQAAGCLRKYENGDVSLNRIRETMQIMPTGFIELPNA